MALTVLKRESSGVNGVQLEKAALTALNRNTALTAFKRKISALILVRGA